jgi:hypothetical protein
MRGFISVVALGVTMWLPTVAQSTEISATQSAETSATPTKCLEALVNPVTGYTFCVNPRGAPVEAPPPPSEPASPVRTITRPGQCISTGCLLTGRSDAGTNGLDRIAFGLHAQPR